MLRRDPNRQTLPRPTAIHHIVEDFLTMFDAPSTHLTPLRRFLDHVLEADLRARFAEPCLLEAMTFMAPSVPCAEAFVQGQGLTAAASA